MKVYRGQGGFGAGDEIAFALLRQRTGSDMFAGCS